MSKRKTDSGNRAFQKRREAEYVFIDIAGKPLCLICGANEAVIKEFHLRHHFETKHRDQLTNPNAEQELQRVEALKKNLTFQQMFFTGVQTPSEAAVTASFIAKSGRPFTEVCVWRLVSSLSRNTVANRACEMATDLRTQKEADFITLLLWMKVRTRGTLHSSPSSPVRWTPIWALQKQRQAKTVLKTYVKA